MTTTEIYAQPQLMNKVGLSAALAIPEEWRMWGRLAMIGQSIAGLKMDHGNVVDLGCGYGDLSAMLPKANYVGVDMYAHILQEAQRRYPNRKFVEGKIDDKDLRGTFELRDVTVAAGILATVSPQNFISFMQHMQEWADRFLILTWLDPVTYGGKLHTYTLRDMVNALGDDFKYVGHVNSIPGDRGQTGGTFVRVR
jgi:SAM-dependent methyltransferase